MAFVYGDRVKESSSSVGTGDFVLEGAATGFQSFADGIGEGNQTYYVIVNDSQGTWEIGIGTYTAGTLVRSTVLASTSGGGLVNFASGTKTVGATISRDFYGNTLATSTHPGIDHTGLPGVPEDEQFTQAAHEAVDHTAVAFGLLQSSNHESIDHTLPPLLLQTLGTHAALDHTGIAGINNFDEALHAATNHSSVLGVPSPEVFTALAHSMVDHTGLPGVGGVPSIGKVQIISGRANATSLNLNLTAGTWAVFAYAAYRCNSLNGGLQTDLRIASVVVSSWGDDNDPEGWMWYKHFGFRTGVPGSQVIVIDFDTTDQFVSPNKSPVIMAFAVRTA